MVGNKVSHANNKTKRRFNVNITKKRFYIPGKDRWITLRISAAGIKTVNSIGIEKAIKRAQEKQLIK